MKAYWQKDLSIRFLSLKQIQETIQEHKIKTEAKIQTNNEIFKLWIIKQKGKSLDSFDPELCSLKLKIS